MAVLYIVSTPIGNLGDLSPRAVEVLRAADVIFAEDTRRTGGLLHHFGIEGRMISAHEHNEAARARLVTTLLEEGRSVALVSDAGTPLLSDPGGRVVGAALAAGYEVIPIPGPSALLAALVASGLPADRFTFYGFLPRKGGGRDDLLQEIASSRHTAVIYESPQRILALLEDLARVAGEDRPAALAREVTKVHEEFARGTLGEIASRVRGRPPRGEIVLVVEGAPEPVAPGIEDVGARVLAEALLAQRMAPSAVARELRQRLEISRNDAYQLVQRILDADPRG